MSNIKEVLYKVIDDKYSDKLNLKDYYFYNNMKDISDKFLQLYMTYDENQFKLRQEIIKDSIECGEINNTPNYSRTILGISTMKNKSILISELE